LHESFSAVTAKTPGRKRDVIARTEERHQVVLLKNETNATQAECGASIAAGMPRVNALNEHRSSRRLIENAK
jgi:hypothetical protein